MKLSKIITALVLCNVFSGCSFNPLKAYVEMDATFKKAPVVTPFSDNYWLLKEDLTFEATRASDGKYFSITIPAGFVTDLASIPVPLNVIYDKTGRYSSAGILHDYLYWTQFCDRKRSDRMIKEGLKATEAGYFSRNTIKFGVYLFGWVAWESNEKSRANGEERFIPIQMRSFPSETRWEDYRKIMDKKITIPWSDPDIQKQVQVGCDLFPPD